MTTLDQLLEALKALRIPAKPEETAIHRAIEALLARARIPYTHECQLTPRSRIDFLCDHIGIEVKKGKPPAPRLRAQLTRYLAHPQLEAVIVVLQTPCPLPDRILGKPVRVLSLNRLWGIALP